MINVFQPSLGQAELEAVAAVFADNWLGQGPRTALFEAEFAEHVGVPAEHMMFINSCTAGLFLATELIGVGPGDDVVLPSISFLGAGNAIAVTGARPVFCDVDPETLNPTVAHVKSALTPSTKAVVILHYGGYPGDVAAIARLCRERGIVLIEDAACAVASTVDGQACGTFGDIAMWSFDAMKILVTGDGGMFYVRDPELARRARRLTYHGLELVSGYQAKEKVARRWWEPQVQEFGRRIIGNDMTAAIGSVQLRRLPEFVARRKAVAQAYDELLDGADGVRVAPPLPAGHASSYYHYWVQMDPRIRDHVAADLLDRGIYTTFRYAPLHRVPIFGAKAELPGADRGADSTLLLPIHQGLTDSDVHAVVRELGKAVEHRLDEASPTIEGKPA